MVFPGREKLSGTVEVDETYLGGKEMEGKRSWGTENKELVVADFSGIENEGYTRTIYNQRRRRTITPHPYGHFIVEKMVAWNRSGIRKPKTSAGIS
jgi:hypothetical protein